MCMSGNLSSMIIWLRELLFTYTNYIAMAYVCVAIFFKAKWGFKPHQIQLAFDFVELNWLIVENKKKKKKKK
jgi:hypothetical protein